MASASKSVAGAQNVVDLSDLGIASTHPVRLAPVVARLLAAAPHDASARRCVLEVFKRMKDQFPSRPGDEFTEEQKRSLNDQWAFDPEEANDLLGRWSGYVQRLRREGKLSNCCEFGASFTVPRQELVGLSIALGVGLPEWFRKELPSDRRPQILTRDKIELPGKITCDPFVAREFSISDAARIVGVSRDTMQKHVTQGYVARSAGSGQLSRANLVDYIRRSARVVPPYLLDEALDSGITLFVDMDPRALSTCGQETWFPPAGKYLPAATADEAERMIAIYRPSRVFINFLNIFSTSAIDLAKKLRADPLLNGCAIFGYVGPDFLPKRRDELRKAGVFNNLIDDSVPQEKFLRLVLNKDELDAGVEETPNQAGS